MDGILVPSGSVVKNMAAMQEPQETWVQYLGWEDSLEEGMVTYSIYFCLENSFSRGAWWAAVLGSAKSLT